MSSYYAAVSALIFSVVAVVHLVRLSKGWSVQIGTLSVPMSASWFGLVVSGLLAIWGFLQVGH